MEEEPTCVSCGVPLEAVFDAAPNGDMGCKCARCEAEEAHDFNKAPNVRFTRSGQRMLSSFLVRKGA